MISLLKIQKWMEENNKDVLLINRTDEFLSEYIAPYAERLQWLTKFSGSAGRAIIEKNKAYIYVDGRYTNQVKQEVDKNFFEIKHLKEYWTKLEKYKKEKKIIALDESLHSINEVNQLEKIFKFSKCSLSFLERNPIDFFWKDQPKFPNSLAFLHEEKYAGDKTINKIKKIQYKIKQDSIDYYLLNTLDSIAWLLNIRGNDINYTPLICCYVIIPKTGKVELFIEKKKVKKIIYRIDKYVNVNSFKNFKLFINKIKIQKTIGIDKKESPYLFKKICKDTGLKIHYLENPCLYLKAKKNLVEIEGAKKANIRDGVTISKFLYWLKNKIDIGKMDEIKASQYLLALRKKNELFYSPSFETISAFGKHAALPHYRVSKKSNLRFKKNQIYLFDSGGQYFDGTTDITRTVIIGKPNNEQKDRFTRVLKGHIAIAVVKFPKNSKGSSIDHLARKWLNEINCDFDHGTGHGIGSFLSVHEGPQRIAKNQGQSDGILKEGMIVSNEPGYYKEEKYGIRIENLILCVVNGKNSLRFETISWAPIDRDLIKVSLLTKDEIDWVNNYHNKVYENLNKYLDEDERNWLYLVTKPL